ncbi:MAG: class I SAM-dependent methyltransferase [Candidatus Omnitrophica bacterium]|nr:class I SAM-dependent methyltransferase [Candidatus Omnitrophota bacterium]
MKNNPGDKPQEAWQPLPNVAPDNLKNRTLFYLRLFLDLEVFTTYWDVRKAAKRFKGNVLEIGCGLQPYRHLMPEDARYHALDWEGSCKCFHYTSKEVTYYDGGIFPFKDSAFNFIFHTEVLEHVFDIKQFLSECHRVLPKGGEMVFTIPFAARYHYIPNDYWRLTPAAAEKLLEGSGFERIVVSPRGNDIAVAVSKLNAVFYRIIMKKFDNIILKILNTVFFGSIFSIPIFCLTIIGHLSILFKVGSPNDPLGYTITCRR